MNNPTDKIIRLENIVKSFDGEQVLKNVSLEIGDREFVTLLGPSGCGKTTTLRIIGGFESPDEGTVYFDGKAVNDVPPYKRPVNTVFQKYALFPHLNVFENIAFGPKLKGASGPTGFTKCWSLSTSADLKSGASARFPAVSSRELPLPVR